MRPPYIFFQDYRVGLKLAMCEVHGLMVHAIGTGPETLFVFFFTYVQHLRSSTNLHVYIYLAMEFLADTFFTLSILCVHFVQDFVPVFSVTVKR